MGETEESVWESFALPRIAVGTSAKDRRDSLRQGQAFGKFRIQVRKHFLCDREIELGGQQAVRWGVGDAFPGLLQIGVIETGEAGENRLMYVSTSDRPKGGTRDRREAIGAVSLLFR
jgi:hypothetical protein